MSLRGASHTCQCCPSTCGLLVCPVSGPRLHPWSCKSPTLGKQIAQGAGHSKLSSLHGLRECFTHMQVLPQHLWLVGLHSCWPPVAMAAPMGVPSPQPLASRLHKVQVFQSCAASMGLGNASHTCHCCPSTCGLLVCSVSGLRLPWLHPWGCQVPNPWQADCTRCRSSQAVQLPWA
jgi:hypothetical protein